MPIYKVTAVSSTYYDATVEAEDAEEAYDKARRLDDSKWVVDECASTDNWIGLQAAIAAIAKVEGR